MSNERSNGGERQGRQLHRVLNISLLTSDTLASTVSILGICLHITHSS